MRTFLEYVEQRQKLEEIFESIIVEAEANPAFNELLIQEGFWGNLGNAIKTGWQGMWSGGGIKPGAQAAWSAMTGPATQLGNAVASLNKALAAIQKDPNWSKSMTTGGTSPSGTKYPAMELHQWLKDTIQELTNQQKQFQNKQLPGTGMSAVSTAASPAVDPATGKPYPAAPPGTPKSYP